MSSKKYRKTYQNPDCNSRKACPINPHTYVLSVDKCWKWHGYKCSYRIQIKKNLKPAQLCIWGKILKKMKADRWRKKFTIHILSKTPFGWKPMDLQLVASISVIQPFYFKYSRFAVSEDNNSSCQMSTCKIYENTFTH